LQCHIECSGNIREKKIIAADGNSILVADAAAPITKKKPAHDGNSGVTDVRKISGNNVPNLPQCNAGVAPWRAAKVRAVSHPRIVNGKEEVATWCHREMIPIGEDRN
jgi:hypothetical protein